LSFAAWVKALGVRWRTDNPTLGIRSFLQVKFIEL
jgi:hypothetical protein